MERLGALEREHGLEPEPEDYYRYAQAWEAAVHYLQLRGREAEHYEEALHLMNRAESGPAVPGTRAGGSATRAGCRWVEERLKMARPTVQTKHHLPNVLW